MKLIQVAFVIRDGVTQPHRAAVSQKEPSKINSDFLREGSRHIPVDTEHYERCAKNTAHFAIVSVRANCQQQLSLARGMFQVTFQSALRIMQR